MRILDFMSGRVQGLVYSRRLKEAAIIFCDILELMVYIMSSEQMVKTRLLEFSLAL